MSNKIYHILIVEDELPAAVKLEKLIRRELPDSIVYHCSSIKETVTYLSTLSKQPRLLFMDIRLGDGLSFEIFSQVKITSPIIFTTAYDEYAIKAFKVNSIDYLLKPIDEVEFKDAIQKFSNIVEGQNTVDFSALTKLIVNSGKAKHFFSKQGEKTVVINEQEIAYFYAEDGYSNCRTLSGSKHVLDESLEEIYNTTSETLYFKINRGMIIKKDCIKGFEPYFNNRLVLSTSPKHHEAVIVAREKVKEFKSWLKD